MVYFFVSNFVTNKYNKVKEEANMYRNYRKCYCINNNCDNFQEDVIEKQCNDVMSYEDDMDSCDCGFDDEYSVFPENPMLAQSYVPIQYMDKTFKPCVGLKMGTIFPELVNPYSPCQSMEENAFIEAMNTIGEGCNKC